MKFILLLSACFTLIFQTTSLEYLRNAYPQASATIQSAEKFAAMADRANGSDAAIKGYKAASKIIMAKFEKGKDRKTMISGGIAALESAIKASPNNAELRVIRLSVQENLPKIVGYSGQMKEDKAFILKNYAAQNSALKSYIRRFADVSKTITATEKTALK